MEFVWILVHPAHRLFDGFLTGICRDGVDVIDFNTGFLFKNHIVLHLLRYKEQIDNDQYLSSRWTGDVPTAVLLGHHPGDYH